MRIVYALLVLLVASSMERDGNNRAGRGQRARGDSSRQRRPFFAVSAANIGNNPPDVIPIGGRDRHASRFSMGVGVWAHAPLTRDALRAERIALQNSNSAGTAERLRYRREEARRRRNATQRVWRQQRCVGVVVDPFYLQKTAVGNSSALHGVSSHRIAWALYTRYLE